MAQRNYLINTTTISTTASGTTIGSGNTTSATFVTARTLVRTGIAAGELLSGSQTWSIHYVVSAMAMPYEMRLKLQRLNSSGVMQSESGFTTVRSAAGTYDDNLTWDSGTWAANDQLALVWEHRRPSGTGSKNGTIDANGASYIDAPATAALDLPLGLSDNANILTDGAVRMLGTLMTQADSLQALTEALVQLLSYQLALADTTAANWADSHNLLLSHQLALADSFGQSSDSLFDSFTDTDNTTIVGHTGENGLTWIGHPDNAAVPVIHTNRLTKDAFPDQSLHFTSVPITGDAYVEAPLRMLTALSVNAGICISMSATLDDYVYARHNNSNNEYSLRSVVPGSVATLGTATEALSPGDVRVMRLERRTVGGDDQFRLLVDGIEVIGWQTANGHTGTRVGIRFAGAASTTTGYAFDSFTAANSSAGFSDAFSFSLDVGPLGLTQAAADSLDNLTDAIALRLGQQQSLADSLQIVTDALAIGHGLLPVDSLAQLVDALAVNSATLLSFSDTLSTLSDAVVTQLGTVLSLVDDANSLNDAVELLLTHELSLSDPVEELTDSLALVLAPVTLTLALYDGGPFPSTPVLDDFNRADEDPATGWTRLFTSDPSIEVVDNQATGVITSRAVFAGLTPADDQEAHVSISTGQTTGGIGGNRVLVFLRVSGETSDEAWGYFVYAEAATVRLYRFDSRSISEELGVFLLGSALTAGDQIGARAIGDSLEVWVNTQNSGWERVITATDATYSAGKIGLGVGSVSENPLLLDNFGGGSIVVAGLTDALAHELLASPSLTLDLSDTLTALDDSLTLGHGLLPADTLELLTETLALHGAGLLVVTDSLTLTDAESHLLELRLAFTELLALDDALSLGYGLLFADTITLTDAYAHDLINTVEGTTEEVADDINLLVDALALGLGVVLDDDAAHLDDAEAHTLGQLLTPTDTLASFSDELSLLLTQQFSFDDSLDLNDDQSSILGHRQSLTDTLANLADAEVNQLGYLLAFSDSVDNLSDTYAQTLAIELSFTDSITLSDSTQIGYGLVFTEDLDTLTDEIATSAPQGPLRQVGVTDSVDLLADALSLRLDYLLAVADDAETLAGSLTLIEDLRPALGDSFTLTDAATSTLDHLLPLVDSLLLTDAIQLRLGYELTAEDATVLTDAITLALNYSLALGDNASNWADSLAITPGLTLIISDNAPTLTDAIEFFGAGLLPLADTLALTDSLAKFSAGFLSLDDALTIADDVAIDLRGPDLDAFLSDSLTLTDAISLSLNDELQLQLALIDTITLTDHYFDLRYPYTPSAKRHIVVPSRARTTTPTRRQGVVVPVNDRTTKVG